MYNITIRYGLEETNHSADSPITVAQLRSNYNLRAALGYGDNTKFMVNGVELPADAVIPNGSTVIAETRANSKATA